MFVRRRRTHHERLVKAGRSEERATGWPVGNRIAVGECGTTQGRATGWPVGNRIAGGECGATL